VGFNCTTHNHGTSNEAGHKASATKTACHIKASNISNKEGLSLLKLILKDKFETIKALDTMEIDLIEVKKVL